MNETFSDLLSSASERVVTIRAADGHPLVKAKLLHAAAVVAVGVMVAPRLAAAGAIGALLKGITVSVHQVAEETPAAA